MTVLCFVLHVLCRLTDTVYRFDFVNWFALQHRLDIAWVSVSFSEGKFNNIPWHRKACRGFFVTLPSEAEEETDSAEEQPASNRLSRHTEIMTSGVVRDGYAHYFRRRPWLRKPILMLRCLHCFRFSMRSKASAKLLDSLGITKRHWVDYNK